MIIKKKYLIFCQTGIISTLAQISSIDYITRLALLIKVFIKSGLKYITLDFKFLGQTYIIVYVGAISILFLFVVKKTEAGRSPNILIKPKENNKIKRRIRLDIFKIFFKLLGLLIAQKGLGGTEYEIKNYYISSYSSDFLTQTDIEYLGYALYLSYPIIILILGILLWCVLIGILRISGQ